MSSMLIFGGFFFIFTFFDHEFEIYVDILSALEIEVLLFLLLSLCLLHLYAALLSIFLDFLNFL